MRTSGWFLGLMAASVTLGGCATDVVSEPNDAGTTSVYAFLSVERTETPRDEENRAREAASATFLRVQEGSDPALVAKLVGAIPELPAEGACQIQGPLEASSAPLRTLNPVELLHAGEVVVRSETSDTPLVARAYPDVAHLVSGVVYTSSGREQLASASERVIFDVSGTGDLEGFAIEASMPPALGQLALNGVVLGGNEPVDPAGGLVLSWKIEPDAASDATVPDRYFVDLTGVSPAGASTRVRCSGSPTASLPLPAGVFEQATGLLVTSHRLRSLRTAAPSLAGVDLRLDTARSMRVQLSPR